MSPQRAVRPQGKRQRAGTPEPNCNQARFRRQALALQIGRDSEIRCGITLEQRRATGSANRPAPRIVFQLLDYTAFQYIIWNTKKPLKSVWCGQELVEEAKKGESSTPLGSATRSSPPPTTTQRVMRPVGDTEGIALGHACRDMQKTTTLPVPSAVWSPVRPGACHRWEHPQGKRRRKIGRLGKLGNNADPQTTTIGCSQAWFRAQDVMCQPAAIGLQAMIHGGSQQGVGRDNAPPGLDDAPSDVPVLRRAPDSTVMIVDVH
ncbi:uncharacterized protein LOC118356880 [Zalophus californianus]|uniref:Uncharacterized protein LOC118356880 n=1 Tax=Zalophus californianus TaxID=9704 RepID=A0A6P9F6V1_ZALCA|nr:uncharacterized protein LOC118356880 [Zalophus californianus]